MIRVIGGQYKGHNLKVPAAKVVRPTANRVREALFNIIGDAVTECIFGDFFAGSGGIGIEAMSRGAKFCLFIEKNRLCGKIIRENLQKTGLSEKTLLVTADIKAGIKRASAAKYIFDFIYVDPPYAMANIEQILENISTNDIINNDSVIILEHAKKNGLPELSGWNVSDSRAYGETSLSFIKR